MNSVKITDQKMHAHFPSRLANGVHIKGPTAIPAIAAESYEEELANFTISLSNTRETKC
jgi:hypothetical protein